MYPLTYFKTHLNFYSTNIIMYIETQWGCEYKKRSPYIKAVRRAPNAILIYAKRKHGVRGEIRYDKNSTLNSFG